MPEALEEPRMLLATYGVELKDVYLHFAGADLPWQVFFREGLFEEIPLVAQLKALAKKHMKLLAERATRARDGIIDTLVSDVHVVVATSDAMCKFQSGSVKGCIRRAVEALTPICPSLTRWRRTTLSRCWRAT